MSQAASQAKKYFLGINGEQVGPLSESDVVARISQGQVPPDALMWFEGLPEWKALQSVPAFAQAFARPSEAQGSAPAEDSDAEPSASGASFPKYVPSKKSSVDKSAISTFAGDDFEPVFSRNEAVFDKRVKFNFKVMVPIGIAVAGVLVLGALYFFGGSGNPAASVMAPKGPGGAAKREADFRKAESELLLNTKESLDTLRRLVKEKPDDAIGKQALSAAVEYYKIHSPVEAGRLMLESNHAEEAVHYFLIDPPDYRSAEAALSKAIEATTDPVKKKQLFYQDIDMLLGPLAQRSAAFDKIKLLYAAYPNDSHPYSYYLKPNEEKLKDIFDRISFFYVKNLLAYVESEFPQVNLASRPLVELRREKDGRYRIVGTYKGEVTLNRDHLTDIHFLFWLDKERWFLVDSNITAEREKSTHETRDKLKDNSMSADAMLTYLEQTFKTQFPNNGLHEHITEHKTATFE